MTATQFLAKYPSPRTLRQAHPQERAADLRSLPMPYQALERLHDFYGAVVELAHRDQQITWHAPDGTITMMNP